MGGGREGVWGHSPSLQAQRSRAPRPGPQPGCRALGAARLDGRHFVLLPHSGKPGHEIVERCARFSIEIQDNFKLISDYPSDLPGFTLSEVVRWPHSSARAAAYRLLNELEGRASKFMFRASAQ